MSKPTKPRARRRGNAPTKGGSAVDRKAAANSALLMKSRIQNLSVRIAVIETFLESRMMHEEE